MKNIVVVFLFISTIVTAAQGVYAVDSVLGQTRVGITFGELVEKYEIAQKITYAFKDNVKYRSGLPVGKDASYTHYAQEFELRLNKKGALSNQKTMKLILTQLRENIADDIEENTELLFLPAYGDLYTLVEHTFCNSDCTSIVEAFKSQQ